MEKVVIFVLILANIGLQSVAEVTLPFKQESYDPTSTLTIRCSVANENFVGWIRNNKTIQQYAKPEDIKGSVGVLTLAGVNPGETVYALYLPENLPRTIGGDYICKGQTTSRTLEIVIKYNIIGLQLNQQLHIGEKGTIVVGAHSYPKSTFTWKKDGQALDFAGSAGRLTVLDDGSIEFSNVLKSDGGDYRVVIDWQGRNTADKTIKVTVVEKPKFISAPTPAKFIGVKGYDYEFCVNVSGIPPPTLSWFKTNIQFDTSNSRYRIAGNCIRIDKLEQMDVAPYKCTAKNTAGEKSTTFEIERLGENPTVNAFPKNVYKANVGSEFELKCSGKGDPLPTLEWSKDGKVLTSSKGVLTISSVKKESSGNYTCTAKNGLIHRGKEITESKTITLLAIIKPSINDDESDSEVFSYVNNPNKVTFECYFLGVPKPTVTLTKNGTDITTGLEFIKYTMKTNSINDFGNYYCIGENIHGNYTHTVKVTHATVPGEPASLSADKTCNSITLIWQKPLSNGHMPIINYVVTFNATAKWNVKDGNSRFRMPYEFEPMTTYNFTLEARNIIGNGHPRSIPVTTEKYCKPSPPSIWNLKSKEITQTLVVKWNAPEFNGFDPDITYTVSWRPRQVPEAIWKKSQGLKETNFTIPDELLIGNTYEIQVTATNKAGQSDPGARIVQIVQKEDPLVSGKRSSGLGKGVIAGIVIAILLIILITIDLFCCFFNSCGVIFCCQKACCGKKYEVDGKGNEMEKLNKNPPPENV